MAARRTAGGPSIWTAASVEAWRAAGRRVEIISPLPGAEAVPSVAEAFTASSGEERVVKAMLFGDAFHFSELAEPQVQVFVTHLLGTIGSLLWRTAHAPILANTWGDGLYFVFDTAREAGLFALELAEVLGSRSWADVGLPETMALRIGLHAGPVYPGVDPVTERPNFTGVNVSRAARIEPITPPGQVYASEPFAALAAADGTREFISEYVGETPLAKGYGVFRTYHLRPTPR